MNYGERVHTFLQGSKPFFYIAHYAEAMKEGSVPAAYFRLMLLGAGGSGKSSLLDGLMNIPLKIAESTALADTRKVTFQWVQAADAIDEAWKEYTTTDEERDLATYAQYHTENKKVAVRSIHKQGPIKPPNQFRLKTDTTKNISITPVKSGFVKKVSQLKIATYKDIFERVKEKTYQTGETFDFMSALDYEFIQTHLTEEKPNVVMHVWDCGGQPIFLDVLAAFLTSRTMFFLLFDASIHLDSLYQEKWHHKGRVIKGREQCITNIELMIQWLQLIHSSLVARKEGLPLSHSAGSLPKYPRAMLIGSRRDLITPQVASDTQSQLQSACTSATFGDLVVNTLLVDNTKSGKGKEEDPYYQTIRGHVKKFADSLIVPTPLSWVALRQVLQKMSNDNPVLTYSQVQIIAEKCDILKPVVPSVLHFYHQLGAVLHYANIPSLDNTVIIEPQWLIEQLRLLLMPAWFGHRQQDQNMQRFWNWLDEKGILCQELYQEIWKDCGLVGGPQALVDLLEHFDLAKRIEKFPHDMSFYKGLKYFVPCFLKVRPKSGRESLSIFNPIREAADLHILFNMGYVPPGFFVRLIAHMTNHKEYVPLLDQKKVYRNSIVFQCRDIDRVIISESLNSVSVKIFRVTNRKNYHCHFSKSCIQLREEVSNMCWHVLHKWMPSIEHKLAFICTCPGSSRKRFAFFKFYHRDCPDSSKKHFVVLKSHHRDSVLYCDLGHEYTLSPKHEFWLDPSNKEV